MSREGSRDLPRVELFGREGCHLCDEAREALLALRREGAVFDLVEVDIDSDDELLKSMLERIPVIEVEGAKVCELGFDERAVRASLASL